METAINPFAKPYYVAAKPVGAQCNLRCEYCYYLEKKTLETVHTMPDDILEMYVRQFIEGQTLPYVLFTWHGGEPLLRDIKFLEKVVSLEEKYAGGRKIDNCIQTNGTLVTEETAEFFARNEWLVGVSIDGTEEMHDRYRKTVGGGGSHSLVMKGIERLNRHGAMWNAMSVISKSNVGRPAEYYDFFRQTGCKYIQFTPVVERVRGDGRLSHGLEKEGELTSYSIEAEEWGAFLIGVFEEWVRRDVGEYFVQMFDTTLANWMGVTPGLCSMSATCGNNAVLLPDGDVYSCDHFVFEPYKLGNIRQETLTALCNGEKQAAFMKLKTERLPKECKECRWLFLCHGECPRLRFGEGGRNYLCEGYKKYFEATADRYIKMADLIREGRDAADIVEG
ncbi:MAG: anaerobic sulfatase-maturation protein [Bacteroidales bacterium]|nr:anaerobic sulfatase-maturation protein [Bacteroidales bacterium]